MTIKTTNPNYFIKIMELSAGASFLVTLHDEVDGSYIETIGEYKSKKRAINSANKQAELV